MRRYYIWKNGGRIVAWTDADIWIPPPAIEISKEEYLSLGLSAPIPGKISEPSMEDLVYADLADAIIEGINEV